MDRFSVESAARRNQLLNGLSLSALSRIARELDLRQVHVRDEVVQPNQPIEGVYFPISCVLSTVAEGAGGENVEVATIGNEGMAGISLFLGVEASGTLHTFAQVEGEALWMRARDFRRHLDDNRRLRELLGRYTQALLSQIAQASACNRIHALEERFARWLLMTHDRVNRDEFGLTQEFMAQMLGVRRATVSEAASSLQDAQVIRYARGIVTVLNRAALEQRSCECYRIIRDEYTRLLADKETRASA